MGVNDINNRQPSYEAKNVVKMGLNMIDIIEKVKIMIGFVGLNMRIGIHTVLNF